MILRREIHEKDESSTKGNLRLLGKFKFRTARRRFHPDKDENCSCGEGYQTREHILRDCEHHNKHCIHLLRVSRDIFLPTILGTVEGITALTTYLEQSGAFTILGRPVSQRETPQFDDEPDSPESDDKTSY